MLKRIPIGVSSYKGLKEDNYYVVDKTLLIKEFLESNPVVALITRPRRFGKTINMSMLSEFLDITKDAKELFVKTKIMDTVYASKMNQYPVIYITLANAKGTKTELVSRIKREISKEYARYDYVFAHLNRFDHIAYENILTALTNLYDGKLDYITESIALLMKYLQNYYHAKVMLFIDEYDTPFNEAHLNGFYDEIKTELVGILSQALKTSDSLQKAMLTGIQRIAKENIFSDLNNIVVNSVNDKEYNQFFGFTHEETKALLEYYDLKLNEQVKEMYDGYRIGGLEIYNPWSILNYANKRELETYWVNTSALKMIRKAMNYSNDDFKRGYEELIENGYLITQVNLSTSFYEDSSTENLWGLFINAGYLTIAEELMRDRYKIVIVNGEVVKEFEALTANYLKIAPAILNDLAVSFEEENEELLKINYQKVLDLMSINDLICENSYHTLFFGMSIYLMNHYKIYSNREFGDGRSDLTLISKKEKYPSYIIEFKYTKDKNKDLKELANEAISQIVNKRYDTTISGKVRYIGIGNCGKHFEMIWQ